MIGLTPVVAGNLKAHDIFHAAQDGKRFQNMGTNVIESSKALHEEEEDKKSCQ